MADHPAIVIDGTGGEDYTKLADFEAAYDGLDWRDAGGSNYDNLPVHIKTVPVDTGSVTWAGWSGCTLTADHRIILMAIPGQECNGTEAAKNAIISDPQTFSDSNPFYMAIRSIEFNVTAGATAVLNYQTTGGADLKIVKCMIHDSAVNTHMIMVAGISTASTLGVYGCLLNNCGNGAGVFINDADVTAAVWNTTFYDMGNDGTDYGAGTFTITNNAFGLISDEAIDHGGTETYNCEDDSASEATCVGTGSTNGELATNMWETPGSDFVPKAGSALIGTGTTQPADFLTETGGADMAGTTWDTTNEVRGAFEYPVVGGLSIPIAMHHYKQMRG